MRKRYDRILPENERLEEGELTIETGKYDPEEGVNERIFKLMEIKIEKVLCLTTSR